MSLAPGCEDLKPGEVSGLLLTHLGEIWVDAFEAGKWDTRRRFTVGHEVGHYLIHRDGRPQIFCRKVDIVEDEEPERTGPAPKPAPELEADAFAAALLMPEHLIREEATKCGANVDAMKERFNCSHKAMKYRLHVLG
jgi:Zn-dependent peptidase ImmA (M78 family)